MSEWASWTAASEVSTIVPNEEEGWGDDVNWLAININGATSFAGIDRLRITRSNRAIAVVRDRV